MEPEFSYEKRDRLWSKFVDYCQKGHAYPTRLAVEALQIVDLDLLKRERALKNKLPATAINALSLVEKHQHLCALSALWVLGGYELVRTLDERLATGENSGFRGAQDVLSG